MADTLKKNVKGRIVKLWEGTKKNKPVHDARRIANEIGVPRRQVMNFLEDEGLNVYSPGSYA